MPSHRLTELLGQPEASAFLRGVVERGRFANAYLFHGPAGVGKGTAALAFARAILCERSLAPAAEPGLFGDAAPVSNDAPGDACNECASCLRTAALQHPDLKFLFPVSGEEKDLDSTIAETIAAWREDPLFTFTYEKAASIRISVTRELLREMAFKPFEAKRRVIVVRDADRMREDQYSAMLKTIEEPGASSLWVLTTSRPSRLPATIRSRCQRVPFRPLGEPMIVDFLETRAEVSKTDARMLAALSGGSLARALAMRDAEPKKLRNESLALLDPALRGDSAGLWKAVQAMNRYGRAGRETLRRLIEFQQLWLRDLLRTKYGAPRESLVNRDREQEIRRQSETITATEVRRRLMVLEEALQAIEGNITPDLALFSAMSRIADPSFDRAEWPAHFSARWDY